MPLNFDMAPPPHRSQGDVGSGDPARSPHALWVPGLGEIPVTLYQKSLWSNTYTEVPQTGARRVRIVVPADDHQRPMPLTPELANAQHRGCVPVARSVAACFLGILGGGLWGLAIAATSTGAVVGLSIGAAVALVLALFLMVPPEHPRPVAQPATA